MIVKYEQQVYDKKRNPVRPQKVQIFDELFEYYKEIIEESDFLIHQGSSTSGKPVGSKSKIVEMQMDAFSM